MTCEQLDRMVLRNYPRSKLISRNQLDGNSRELVLLHQLSIQNQASHTVEQDMITTVQAANSNEIILIDEEDLTSEAMQQECGNKETTPHSPTVHLVSQCSGAPWQLATMTTITSVAMTTMVKTNLKCQILHHQTRILRAERQGHSLTTA